MNIAAKVSPVVVNIDIMCYDTLVNHRIFAKNVVEGSGRNETSKFIARNIDVMMRLLAYKNVL